jgi:hypothetical protein
MIAFCREWVVADPGWHIRADDLAVRFEAYLDGQGHPRWSRTVTYERFEGYWSHRGVHVTKRYTKHDDRLSHGSYGDPPKSYQAWHGVRWATDANRAEPVSQQAEHEPVSEVSDQYINRLKIPTRGGNVRT